MFEIEAIKELAKEMVVAPDTATRKKIAFDICAICNSLNKQKPEQVIRVGS